MQALLLLLIAAIPVIASATATATASVNVYSSLPPDDTDSAVTRKQKYDLEQRGYHVYYLTLDERRAFVEDHCPSAFSVWDTNHLQSELFKWCALSKSTAKTTLFLDSSSPILTLPKIEPEKNIAVLDDKGQRIHGSYIQISTASGKIVARKMLQILIDTDNDLLKVHALLVPRTLYALMTTTSEQQQQWTFWSLKCRKVPVAAQHQLTSSPQHPQLCPKGYCCSIQDQDNGVTVMMSRHYILPFPAIPENHELPAAPYNGQDSSSSFDLPFVSTISVKEIPNTSSNGDAVTPNFYDILKSKDCLPAGDDCSRCLREKNGANQNTCMSKCKCYCTALCRDKIPAKRIAQEWTVTPPCYSKDPDRLVPRIIHQTWIEALTPKKYPNMSRMVESFKQAGWEYRFYSDQDAIAFLKVHFPPAVLEAYEALIPGAFKADLFRYCVLLISGGVYADVDIQLESALDVSIPPDVGFMAPIDEPGKPVNKQMCLWNGFIASAPAHPFLAKAIETVVNQVRNRFTSVDVDATFCPNPELSVLHAYDTLFTAGPCLLGSSINRVVGRNGQHSHVPGEMKDLWTGAQRERTKQGTSFVLGVDDDLPLEHRLPGRAIILHQNKWDMGAHRFTFLEQNLVVAATDLPDSDDREHIDSSEGGVGKTAHYSSAHAKVGVYGVEHLYVDQERANEEIRIFVDASMHAKKQTSAAVE